MDGEGGSSERCLKWGGGGGELIKESFQKRLKTGDGFIGGGGLKVSPPLLSPSENFNRTPGV